MKVFNFLLLLAALFLVPQQRPASTTGQLKDFTLTVTTPQRSYLEFQPIPIVISLKNETNRPLMGHTIFDFAASYFHLFVLRDDGPHELSRSTMIADIIGDHREFRPGEEAKKTGCLQVRLSKAFPKPGKYQLTAELRSLNGSPSVSSQPFEVEIVAPQGLDAEALEFIRANGDPDYFFTGVQWGKSPPILEMSVVENFLALYAESAYGDDATLLLGELQYAKREYLKARATFQNLAKKPGYPFASDVARYLKYIDHELDRQAHP
jgi:hypothetical protein